MHKKHDLERNTDKMKKIVIVGVLALAFGLFAGYIFFGENQKTKDEALSKDVPDLSDADDPTKGDTHQVWTCSMHPQIRNSEPGDCPICGMDLIPEATGGGDLQADQFTMSKNAIALANVQTTIVGAGFKGDNGRVSLSGKININEDETYTQPAHFNGRIEKLYVKSVGEQVKKGQPIAEVYSPTLVAAQQELITAFQMREDQPALYKAVRQKFKNWMIHGPILDKIAESGEVQNRFMIYAHVSGTVTDIKVNQGSHIMDAMPIFSVADLNTVWASFDVYENQIAQFEKGQKIKVGTNAYPDKTFPATVSFIDPVLDQSTRTVTLRATLNNKNGLLKPGMFVTGIIDDTSQNLSNNISIPSSAVLWTGERSLVYVKVYRDEPVFEMREITLGARQSNRYQVLNGLQNGDEIVTHGTFTIDAAAQLQGKKSMMNQSKVQKEAAFSEMKIRLSPDFQMNFKSILKPYFKMKDAFVASKPEQVSAFAKALLQETEKLSAPTENELLQHHLLQIKTNLKTIIAQKDLEFQRKSFVKLNQNLVPIAINLKDQHPKVYVQKCPMANNNQGAFWLSNDEEIKNPYYGEKMIGCGSVIDSNGMSL